MKRKFAEGDLVVIKREREMGPRRVLRCWRWIWPSGGTGYILDMPYDHQKDTYRASELEAAKEGGT